MTDASPPPSTAPLTIDIVSDNICPWCYVGAKRMEQALEMTKVPAHIRWHPFFLATPGVIPKGGQSIETYLGARYGDSGFYQKAEKHLAEVGSEVGIKFNGGRKMYDTLLSHKLVALARKHNKENELIRELHKAYFEGAANIGDADYLVSVASKFGIDQDEAKATLQDSNLEDEVTKEVAEFARQYRIRGVPYFIISKTGTKQRFVTSGAQPVEWWISSIKAALDLQ